MTNSIKIKRSLHSPTTKNYTSLHSIFFKVRPHSQSKESLLMIINFKEYREHSVASLTKIGVVFPSLIVVVFNNIKGSIISVCVPQLIICSMVLFFCLSISISIVYSDTTSDIFLFFYHNFFPSYFCIFVCFLIDNNIVYKNIY